MLFSVPMLHLFCVVFVAPCHTEYLPLKGGRVVPEQPPHSVDSSPGSKSHFLNNIKGLEVDTNRVDS